MLPRAARARDYTSASEVLDTIDRLSAEVESGLALFARTVPGAQPFAISLRGDHGRERADRDAIRRRLGLPAAPASASPMTATPTTLEALRATQQELVHAHAEGLPALGDARAVRVIARHLVEASRRLTVIDMWIELETGRAG